MVKLSLKKKESVLGSNKECGNGMRVRKVKTRVNGRANILAVSSNSQNPSLETFRTK